MNYQQDVRTIIHIKGYYVVSKLIEKIEHTAGLNHEANRSSIALHHVVQWKSNEVKVNWHFREHVTSIFRAGQWCKNSACWLFHVGFLLGLFFRPAKCWLTFTGLHDTIFQKILLLITALRTWNLHMKQFFKYFSTCIS